MRFWCYLLWLFSLKKEAISLCDVTYPFCLVLSWRRGVCSLEQWWRPISPYDLTTQDHVWVLTVESSALCSIQQHPKLLTVVWGECGVFINAFQFRHEEGPLQSYTKYVECSPVSRSIVVSVGLWNSAQVNPLEHSSSLKGSSTQW